MRTLMISAAAVALSAGVAFANPGIAQLAAEAGVSPNGYTQNQLIQLLDAQRDNDTARVQFIMSQAGQSAVTRSDMGAGAVSNDAQLAAAAGVEPGVYTINELQRLIDAKDDNDDQEINFILSGQNRANAAPSNVVSPGQVQLAATLGVDPSEFTLAELTQMYGALLDDRS